MDEEYRTIAGEHVEVDLTCPACKQGRMRTYGAAGPMVNYRRCSDCGYTAKYQRIKSSHIAAITVIKVFQDS
jgi:uncharacterized protein (DUF983 family)